MMVLLAMLIGCLLMMLVGLTLTMVIEYGLRRWVSALVPAATVRTILAIVFRFE